jgi:acetyl-CoA carboxylase biotin carboxyl carrier protein
MSEQENRLPKSKLDKEAIRELAELLAETNLSEIEWSDGTIRIRVARGVPGATVAVAPGPAHAPVTVAVNAAAPANAEEDVSKLPGALKSPMVGTAYVAPEPGAAPFVQVGDNVREGQTVMIVEAMKTMNAIPAHRSGKVTRILVENQTPVEFGQVLMLIE